jgi:phage-related minor tail protein
MTNSLKSQLELSADASGVKAGVNEAKKSLASLGATAQAEGKKAAEGMDKIGAGGENTSKKVDKTTRSLIQSIERTTATLEAGGRANVKYFETLAGQRGVDVNTLKPYLEQLDAVSKRQAQLTPELEKGGIQFDKYGRSVKQNTQALRQVPAQLTDIIVGLQGGQAPLTVLLQQGGQLRDVFGGIAPAAKALGGAVLGLVNPYTVLAGAVVGLGAAYNSGSKEADAYAKGLILTGNAAGATVDGLADMAERIDGVVGTQAAAAAALAEFAANGNIAGNSLERFSTIAIRMEKVTGQAVKDTVKQFAELGKSPVEAAVKLNESTNFLTESIYNQIRALEAQGRTAEAASVAQQAYADAMDSRLGEIEGRLGLVERGWKSVKSAAAETWDAMLGVGRSQTLGDQLAEATRTLESLQNQLGQAATTGLNTEGLARDVELQKQRVDILRENQRLLTSVADRQRESTERVKARVAFDKEADKFLEKRVQMEREIAKINEIADKAQVSRLERERLIAAIREKYKEPDKTGEAQDAIIAAKIAPLVAAAEAAVNADFEATDKLAKDQIKALVEGSIEERQQILKSIDDSYAANDKKLQEEAGFVDGKWVGNLKKVDDAARQLGLTFTSAFEDAIVNGGKFSDVLKGIEKDLIRIAVRKSITEPAAAKLAGVFGGFFGGGSSIPIDGFDGGGYTGSGARSGGLDGKGGFMAMLHPQETVIDHTKGTLGSGGSTPSVVYSPVYNIDARADRAEILQLVDRSVREGNAQLVDKLSRQGALR